MSNDLTNVDFSRQVVTGLPAGITLPITQADVTDLVTDLAAKASLPIAQADVTDLTTDLAAKEDATNKGALSGYASLDAGGQVPLTELGNVPAGGGITNSAPLTNVPVSDGTNLIASRITDDAVGTQIENDGAVFRVAGVTASLTVDDDGDEIDINATLLLLNGAPPVVLPITQADVTDLVTDLAALLAVLSVPVAQICLWSLEPTNGTNTTLTPLALTAIIGVIYPFTVPVGGITINKIIIKTPASVATALQLAIYDSAGTQVYASGAISTAANYTVVTAALPVVLTPGVHYIMFTNNASTNGSGVLSCCALLPAASLPRWGQYVVSGGNVPASIVPANIIDATGGIPGTAGFPVFMMLSNF